jgi:hypothetical protein
MQSKDTIEKDLNGKIMVALDQLDRVRQDLIRIESKIDGNFVTKDRHEILVERVALLQKIVFGVIGVILTTVVSGIVIYYINIQK